MKHNMPQLPYAQNELAPRMSAETLSYHYGKHLQTYVYNLNKLVVGTPYEDMPLGDIVRKAEGPVFNNAAQTWNHTFFFDSLSPAPVAMPGELERELVKHFGAVNAFKEKLLGTAATLFGSGWAWLVADKDGRLSVKAGSNAYNPLREGFCPLLAVDVWEHAYYIDYRNRRPDYLEALWELTDWQKVARRLEGTECNVYV